MPAFADRSRGDRGAQGSRLELEWMSARGIDLSSLSPTERFLFWAGVGLFVLFVVVAAVVLFLAVSLGGLSGF